VASRLNAMGYHAAPTFGNVLNIGILVSMFDGSKKVVTNGVRERSRTPQAPEAEEEDEHSEAAVCETSQTAPSRETVCCGRAQAVQLALRRLMRRPWRPGLDTPRKREL
jgi:hypothetical protein